MTMQVLQPQAAVHNGRRSQGLSFLVHGLAKAGKSTFGDSGPRPRLILDVEGASYWTPGRKIYWDPLRQTPPQPDGSWDSCIVLARDAATIHTTYRVLNSGAHPFNSLSLDSVTEVQQRLIDEMVGTKKIERDQWGALLRNVSNMSRSFRDLITHPVRPLWSVCMIAGTHQVNGRWTPLLQGQIQDYMPYHVDILGYLDPLPDGTRNLLIGPHPQFLTGERVGGRLPYALQLGYPGRPGYTIETILQQVLQ